MESSNGYASIGHHPKSGYMTSDKYSLHNLSGLDLVDEEIMNFYSKWREAINLDPAIVNKYPGVVLV